MTFSKMSRALAVQMKGLVSEDSVRLALKAMAPESSQVWIRTALGSCQASCRMKVLIQVAFL